MLAGCLFVAPDPVLPARGWLAGLFARAPLGAEDRLGLLAGGPVDAPSDQGEILCTCLGTLRGTIEAAIEADPSVSVAALGAVTGAGTQCGSCRPELAQLISAHGTEHAADGPKTRSVPGLA
jgi:assimilatory nitrate reductase catalytic subunit